MLATKDDTMTIQYGSQRFAIVKPVLRLDAEVLAQFALIYPGRNPSEYVALKKTLLYYIEANGILADTNQGKAVYISGHGINANVNIFCSNCGLNQNAYIFAYN